MRSCRLSAGSSRTTGSLDTLFQKYSRMPPLLSLPIKRKRNVRSLKEFEQADEVPQVL